MMSTFYYRIRLYPGLSGIVGVRARKKRLALALVRADIESWACGASIYIERIAYKHRKR